jgi:hypothetical protein
VELHETDGVTTLTMKLAFRDKAGRDHMTKSDGAEDSFDKMEDLLRSLLDPRERSLGRAPAKSGQHLMIACRGRTDRLAW